MVSRAKLNDALATVRRLAHYWHRGPSAARTYGADGGSLDLAARAAWDVLGTDTLYYNNTRKELLTRAEYSALHLVIDVANDGVAVESSEVL